MYGLLVESASIFGQSEYGEDTWAKVMEVAGYKSTVFNTHSIYTDDILPKLAEACIKVLGSGTSQDFMIFFGRCFVKYCSHYGYDKILSVTGRHFCQFLQEMDNIHAQMRFSFHKMKSPSMVVSSWDCEGAVLQYRSHRKGFAHYLVGQLLQIANDIFNITLNVRIIGEEMLGDLNCVNYRLDFNNKTFMTERNQRHVDFKRVPLPYTSLSKLMSLFPFSIALNDQLKICDMGPRLLHMLGTHIIGSPFHKHFRIRKPFINLSWSEILSHATVTWEVYAMKVQATRATMSQSSEEDNLVKEEEASKDSNGRRLSHRTEWMNERLRSTDSDKEEGRVLLLKGQMYILKEYNTALFFCMPLLNNLDEMNDNGLFLNDLSMHDLSREMVLRGFQHFSKLELMYNRAEENSEKLAESLKLLAEWKDKGDDLLYAMLPRQVAEHLRQGKDPITTCQTFDCVTVLFADIILITDSSTADPLDLVRSMNEMYTLLDTLTDKYQVFKVETVGGVYMVVGGAPEDILDHQEQVASLALHMIEEVNACPHRTHQIRIGIHSGPVVAGVVGNKLPRYCLFGDTVNTASRMLTNGKKDKVHITESYAQQIRQYGFKTTHRGTVHIKGKGEMVTCWLDGK